ncbi:TonB-dependent receptor [Schleiferiaceae bacterium]|nr:TonB-dependent receptor [Schleiferiaceae bacterium]|tara:strand:+ start:1120 stop:3207 length:2088 start_codon:yes stop_codon:yes gene_type:complete
MRKILILSITLLTFHVAAQEYSQRLGFRGVVPKKYVPVELNEVEVNASLGKETYASATKQITILTAKEIQELPVTNINELLDYIAGVDMRQRGPLDVQADLGVRGGTFDQTLVLVNGVRMNNPQTGHHNMNLPVPLVMIERIELIHGGATNAHGIGAMTGVLNIILKSPQKKLNAGYALTTGQHNLLNSSFYAGKKVGKWGVQFGQQGQQTAGYIANTDFKSQKFILNLERDYKLGKEKGTFSVFYAENQKSFGAQNYYTSAFPDQFEATSTRVFALGLAETIGQKTDFKTNINFVSGTDRFELYRETAGLGGFDASEVAYDKLPSGSYYRAADGDSAATFYGGPNFHRTLVFNLNSRLTHRWNGEHETSLGYNQRYDEIHSNVLGGDFGDIHLVPGWDGYTMDKGASTTDFSWFGEHKFIRGRYQLRAGGMLNYHDGPSQDSSYFFAPSMDALYRLTKESSLYATVNRSMRYPTYTDLYYNRGGAQGSINLKPETSWNYEAGYKAKEGNLDLNGVLFHRRSADLIDWVTYADIPDTAFASNITSLALTGIEGGLSYNAKKRKQMLRRAAVEATLMKGNSAEVDYSSLYALDYLQAKITARATQKLGLGFFANYALTIQDRMGTYNSAGTEVDYKPFALLDLKLYYAPAGGIFKRQFPFQAFININNTLDANYYDRGNVVQPGRWISSGFEFRFR